MDDVRLFEARIAMVRRFLEEEGYDGVLLSRVDNFAMATGGKRSYVNIAADQGACSLFVSRDGKACYVGNNIEEPRVMAEELHGFGCSVLDFLWFEGGAAETVKQHFTGRIVSDDGAVGENVDGKLASLRALLTEAELEKYRRLGALAAAAMTATIQAIGPGDTEADIAARLIAEGALRRCHVPVCLVAADDRIGYYRHPLPSRDLLLGGGPGERKVRGYVMVVGCFAREGLWTSITRFKQVGEAPEHIHEAHNRICAVDAVMQEATAPGKTLGDVFAACQEAYASLGFPENEWHNHHQGGPTGYAARTARGMPGSDFPILDNRYGAGLGQAFAWNPSGVGVKSEDTFILLPDGSKEIVTATPELPDADVSGVLGRATGVRKTGIAR